LSVFFTNIILIHIIFTNIILIHIIFTNIILIHIIFTNIILIHIIFTYIAVPRPFNIKDVSLFNNVLLVFLFLLFVLRGRLDQLFPKNCGKDTYHVVQHDYVYRSNESQWPHHYCKFKRKKLSHRV